MAELKMPAINSIIIAGNLTRDPTIRKTNRGTPVSNFPIACSRRYKDSTGNWREEVCYVGIVAWYKLAESCYEHLSKGSAVMVEGELQSKSLKTDSGQFRSIVEIKAKRIQFLSKNNMTVSLEEDSDYESGFNNQQYNDCDPDKIAAQSGNTDENDTIV